MVGCELRRTAALAVARCADCEWGERGGLELVVCRSVLGETTPSLARSQSDLRNGGSERMALSLLSQRGNSWKKERRRLRRKDEELKEERAEQPFQALRVGLHALSQLDPGRLSLSLPGFTAQPTKSNTRARDCDFAKALPRHAIVPLAKSNTFFPAAARDCDFSKVEERGGFIS